MPAATTKTQPHAAQVISHLATAALIAIVATGLCVIAGWVLDVETLKSGLPGFVAMKINTAIGFIMSGVALYLLRSTGRPSSAGRIPALVTAVLGLLTLVEYLLSVELGIDQALIAEPPGAVGTVHPGRMSPVTAFNFFITGMALLLLDRRSGRGRRAAEALALLGGGLSLLGVIGYVYGAEGFYNLLPNLTGIALNTAILFCLLFFAIAVARPHHAAVRLLTDGGSAGILARRMIPAALILPLGLEWASGIARFIPRYGVQAENALHATLTIVLLIVITVVTGKLLKQLDADKASLQAQLEASRDGLELVVIERTCELVQEIHERNAVEVELRESRDRLDQRVAERTEELAAANADLKQFAYVASHDLREPLRMVTSYLTLVSRKLGPDIDDDMKAFIGFAVDGAKRMDALILGLLDYARITRGQTPFVPLALGHIVAESLDNLRVTSQEAGADITVAEGLPTVMGDDIELVRLFQNLVGNAIKYRVADRPIHVSIGWRDDGGEWWVWVKDNGIGIEPEYFEQVFGLFQRLVPRDQFEGTGIGLAVCKKIIENHGGRIWIESTLHEGSTFLFAIPKLPPQASP
jgi:signal transduction histidine kinase